MTKILNSKHLENWNFEFGICLEFRASDFEFNSSCGAMNFEDNKLLQEVYQNFNLISFSTTPSSHKAHSLPA